MNAPGFALVGIAHQRALGTVDCVRTMDTCARWEKPPPPRRVTGRREPARRSLFGGVLLEGPVQRSEPPRGDVLVDVFRVDAPGVR